MIWIPDLPVPVWFGAPDGTTPGPFRSYLDADTRVSCAVAAVDAEWDRPAPQVPARLMYGPHDPLDAPFWACWTAKEAIYKMNQRHFRFVPGHLAVRSWREIPPPGPRILRFFEWRGGFSACVRAPVPGGRRLWIAVATGGAGRTNHET
jgi:hypothetical protein